MISALDKFLVLECALLTLSVFSLFAFTFFFTLLAFVDEGSVLYQLAEPLASNCYELSNIFRIACLFNYCLSSDWFKYNLSLTFC